MATVVIKQEIEAPLQELWRACTDPYLMTSWQADEVEGLVKPGERLTLRWPMLDASVRLEVLRAVAPTRLTVRGRHLKVDFELEPGRITLTQTGARSADEAEGSRSGWRVALAMLAHHLKRHRGLARRAHWLVRPARVSTEAAHVFFTDPAAMSAWLGTVSEPIGEEGAPYALALLPTMPMTGTVVTRVPDRDLALSWHETNDSLLAFRTLPSPTSNDERLIAICWSLWGIEPPQAELAALEHSMDRLARVLAMRGQA